MTKKVVGYVRASTLEQEDTIKTQVERIEGYCKAFGHELVATYIDFGVSGTTPLEDRKHGAEMLAAINTRSKDRPTGVVAVKLDRMFRNAADCLKNVEALDKHGVSLHLIDLGGQSVDTSTSTGKFILTIFAGVAEMERNVTAERTSAVLQSKKRRGEVFNHTPLGFDRAGDKLVKNDSEQALIERMKTLRGEGLSFKRIADTLNGEGYVGKNGGTFGSETVRKVLAPAA